jgi:site-specific DNA-cytosine methylase
MKVLIACEESQTVCKAFRANGHEAYSCDILDCSGGRPEWHIKGDVLQQLDKDWDLVIAHPPCTYLTVTGNRWFNIEKYGDKARQRHRDRKEAVNFFMAFTQLECPYAIENPVGIMSTNWRKPDQKVHPYHFGDPFEKTTLLVVE